MCIGQPLDLFIQFSNTYLVLILEITIKNEKKLHFNFISSTMEISLNL
jgi:hypothetical protein